MIVMARAKCFSARVRPRQNSQFFSSDFQSVAGRVHWIIVDGHAGPSSRNKLEGSRAVEAIRKGLGQIASFPDCQELLLGPK